MKKSLMNPLVLVLACGMAGPVLAATNSAELDKAVASLAAYEDGKDFSGLRAIEALMRSEPKGSPALRDLEGRLASLISGEATREGKTEACKFLCVIGGVASLPALEKVLLDETLSEVACLALSHYPPAADKALREALPRAKGRAALAIAGVMGDRRDPGAVGALAALAKGGDAAGADAAAMALGKIGTPEAAAALGELRASQELPRLPTLMGSLRCAGQLAASGKTSEADALCEQLGKAGYAAHVRRGAFLMRCRLTGGKPAALILALLKSGPDDLKGAALAEVATIQDRAELDKVLAAMPGLPAREQALLVAALARMKADWVRPTVLQAAKSQDGGLRLAAIAALARVGDEGCVPALVGALAKAEDARERNAAVLALRDVPGNGSGKAILAAAEKADAKEKAELIGVLADRGVAEAVPLMQAACQSPEPALRRAALRGFAFLSGTETFPSLIDMLLARAGDPSAGDFERAIVILADKIEPPSARADLLIKTWDARPDATTRAALARVLGALATDPALEKLKQALGEGDAAVRDAAIRALIAWPDDRAVPAVEGIARDGSEDKYRVLALRGLTEMLRKDLGRLAKILGEVLAKSPSAPVAKESLAALAQIPHPIAIRTAATKLADPALKDDAVVAILTAAERCKPEGLPSVKAQIEAASKVAEESLRPRFQGLLEKIR